MYEGKRSKAGFFRFKGGLEVAVALKNSTEKEQF